MNKIKNKNKIEIMNMNKNKIMNKIEIMNKIMNKMHLMLRHPRNCSTIQASFLCLPPAVRT